jgi:hypothetical protein
MLTHEQSRRQGLDLQLLSDAADVYSHVHAHCPNHVREASRAGHSAVTLQYACATSTVCQQPCRCAEQPRHKRISIILEAAQ